MVARSVDGILFTSVKYTKSLPFSLAPDNVIKASRVNCFKKKTKKNPVEYNVSKSIKSDTKSGMA